MKFHNKISRTTHQKINYKARKKQILRDRPLALIVPRNREHRIIIFIMEIGKVVLIYYNGKSMGTDVAMSLWQRVGIQYH